MAKNTNTHVANGYCRSCKFYRGLHNTYLSPHFGTEVDEYKNERCTRKADASAKAEASFKGTRPACFK